MKKIIAYIAAISIVSCSSDFTEISPVGTLSDASLANSTGVDLLLTGAYSVLDGQRKGAGGWTVSGDNWWLDVISDDAHKGSTDGDQADLYAIEIFNWGTSNPYFAGRWKAIFAGVNRANSVISLINSLEDPSLFTVEMAQARFLRGHYNFELQRMWVNVPEITEENFTAKEFNQPNSGPIWNSIEADFQYASENLPTSHGIGYSEPGRPLSWAARAYLGRAQIYQSKWSEALSNLKAVINSGTYALLPHYFDNFRSVGENGSESIFAIQFAADDAQSLQGNQGGTLNFPISGGPFTCCGFYQPTQDLANAFQTDANGLPLLDTYNQSDIANDYGIYSDEPFTPHQGNLDPRIDYTVGRRGIDFNGWGINPGKDLIRAGFGDISGPYVPKKNIYYAGDDTNIGTGGWGQQHSGINYHILRYADVLLMAAEAAVETDDLSSALEWVNEVRSRAKTTPRVQDSNGGDAANYVVELYTSFPDQNYARKAVRFERRLELGMEGHRLFDLRRWGTMVTTLNAYIQNEGRTITPFGQRAQTVQDRHYALPIPIEAIDQSQGALTQNPGF